MSNNIFDKGTIDEIVKKIKEDKTGRMSKTMEEMMKISERAGKLGFTLQDISIIATTGWYLSQNPELKQFFEQLISLPPQPGDDDIYN